MNYGVHRNLAIEFQQSMDEVHENGVRDTDRYLNIYVTMNRMHQVRREEDEIYLAGSHKKLSKCQFDQKLLSHSLRCILIVQMGVREVQSRAFFSWANEEYRRRWKF